MKFTNGTKVFMLLMVSVLSACSSLDLERADSQSSQPQSVPTSSEGAVEAEHQLDAFVLMADELKTQPNQYLEDIPSVPEAARYRFKQALDFKKKGKSDQAKQQFSALTEDYPTLSGPWVQLGDLAMAEKNDETLAQAEAHYRQAVSLNAHNYFARNRLARVLREQGKFAEAEQEYRRSLSSWPGFAKGYLNLGILYDMYMGDKSKALENYQIYQALTDSPQRQVKGWIADLSRQVANQKSAQLAEVSR